MKNLEEENEVLKTIIEDLIEMLRDVIQPNYKQFYYNFIVLKYDIFPTFKSHIAIACDSKKKEMYKSICDSNIDQTIEEEQDIISNEIMYILKNTNILHMTGGVSHPFHCMRAIINPLIGATLVAKRASPCRLTLSHLF